MVNNHQIPFVRAILTQDFRNQTARHVSGHVMIRYVMGRASKISAESLSVLKIVTFFRRTHGEKIKKFWRARTKMKSGWYLFVTFPWALNWVRFSSISRVLYSVWTNQRVAGKCAALLGWYSETAVQLFCKVCLWPWVDKSYWISLELMFFSVEIKLEAFSCSLTRHLRKLSYFF